MPEPTTAISFYDLLLRVAEKSGMAYYGSTGQGKALIPIGAFNLDKVKRIVNDGFRLFDSTTPPRGWHWKNRTASVLLYPDGDGDDNIDSDPARYLLPADFGGQASGPISYAKDTNHGDFIEWVSEAHIRKWRAVTVITGYPLRAAVLPAEPTAGALGASRRWEFFLDPSPVAADTLLFPYTSYFNGMDAEAGTATGGGATTLVDSTRTEVDDYFNTWVLTVIAGTGIHETATITDYTGSSGTFTFSALSGGSTPDTTSVYYVEPAANLHAAGVMFDNAIIAACYAEAEKQIEEINEGAVELFYKVHIPQAHVTDSLSRPRKLRGKDAPVRERTWLNVTTDHDL